MVVAEAGLESTIETPRDFERMLREEGFSRARAKAITAKGFRADLKRPDVSELLSDLERKTQTLKELENKRSGLLRLLSRLGRRGARARSLDEVVDLVAGAYRSARGTPMPIYMFPGETKKFSLPIELGFRSVSKVSISTPNSSHEYYCEIEYFTWTDRGPKKQALPLSHRKTRGEIMTGGRQAVESWLQAERRKLGSDPALDQFDRIVARANAIIRRGLAPVGTITNKRVIASRRAFITEEGRGRTVQSQPFIIRAR